MIPFQVLCEELTQEQTYSYFHVTEKIFSLLTDEDKALVYIERKDPSYRLFYPKDKWIKSLHHTAFKYMIQDALESNDFEKIKFIKNEIKRRKDEGEVEVIPDRTFSNREIKASAQLTNTCRKCRCEYPVLIKKNKMGICSTCENL